MGNRLTRLDDVMIIKQKTSEVFQNAVKIEAIKQA